MEQNDSEILGSDKAGVITARGTGDGLVIRLDGRVEKEGLRDALVEFLHSRRSFIAGNDVALEWVGQRPDEMFVEELSHILNKDFGVNVRSSKLREPSRIVDAKILEVKKIDSKALDLGLSSAAVKTGGAAKSGFSSSTTGNSVTAPKNIASSSGKALSLFDGIEALGIQDAKGEQLDMEERKASPASDSSLWDDPDARIVYATLRSGQKIETEHSLIIIGDVNSGAELVAGGDIVVLGTLRGVAHAGAYDETGGGRVIIALDLQATQLRIGMVISRGGSFHKSAGTEIARVEGNLIVVEPYQAKLVANRKRL